MATLDTCTGQRQVSYRFYVIDATSRVRIGQLHPAAGSSPTLSHDATATVSRWVRGVMLTPDEAGWFVPAEHRIQVEVTVGGSGGGTWPMGEYVAASDSAAVLSRTATTVATDRVVTFGDEMIAVDQGLSAAYAGLGRGIDDVIMDLCDGVTTNEPQLDGTPYRTNASWSVGDQRGTALSDLATAGGYLDPWIDRDNIMRFRSSFDPFDLAPVFDWDRYPTVVRGSITISDETLGANNRFIVVSSDATATGVIGAYDVPSDAPNSYERIGYIVPSVTRAEVSSVAHAQEYARTVAIQTMLAETVTCTTPPDPRHDCYDVIRFLGELWMEIGWTLDMSPGGLMTHRLRRLYSAASEDV